MSLEKLQLSLLDMTGDQKLALIREIRDDRRVSKHAISHKVKQTKDRATKLESQFKGMSPEEKEELIKLLGTD